MAEIPYYSIIPCCTELGTPTDFFNMPNPVPGNDVFVYNGPTAVVNGVLFLSGFCYTIEYEGLSTDVYNNTPTPSTYTSADKTCTSPQCPDCDSLGPYLFEVYNCCDSSEVVTLNLDAEFTTDAVYSYDGLVPFSVGGFTFEPNSCYQITFVGVGTGTAGPSFDDFLYQGLNCAATESCPSCPTTEQYLAFASCCSNTIVYLRPHSTSDYLEGVYEYLGAPVSGLENICYSLTIHDVGVAPIDDITEYGDLPEAPAFVENVTFNTLSDSNTNCADYTLECPSCKKTCYTLYSCDGIFFNTTVNLSDYIGTFISISNSSGPIPGTWYVLVNSGKCNNAIEDITVDPTPPEPCDCRCFEVIGNAKQILYIDCNGRFVKTFGSGKFCAYTYPFVSGTAGEYQVVEGGDCVNDACPVLCYELTECTTSEVITSQSQGLSEYFITEQVIELVGHPGCWQVTSNNAEDCSCPVDVTITVVHADCPTCIGIIAYKLTNCENADDIKYTYDDLSEYVGQSVRTDCGCYFVEQIDYQPTSTSPIVIVSSFTSCTECLRTYYMLTNCDPNEDPIYTYTDLSAYLDQVIRIKECGDACWSIEETDTPINPGIVTVTASFEDCPACTPPIPCTCNRMTNYSTTSKNYEYTNCNNESVLITLAAGETSGKICLKSWVINYPDTDNLEVFGECTDLQDPKFTWDCPETRPKRKIKPGYSVPTCDIEKWEKITCKSSEILYKEVMRLRYGMSNCCPDEDDKWLIKKELIDLAALVDPDYTCTPVQTCGCPPSSCGCGCSSTLKSCSSQ